MKIPISAKDPLESGRNIDIRAIGEERIKNPYTKEILTVREALESINLLAHQLAIDKIVQEGSDGNG